MATKETQKTEGNAMFWFFAFVVAVAVIWWWLNRDDNRAPKDVVDAMEDRLRQAQQNLENAARNAEKVLAQEDILAQKHKQNGTTAHKEEATPAQEEVTPAVPSVYHDLTRISGIGEASQAILYAAGITTYQQLATLSEDALVEIIRNGGGRRSASIGTWAKQAQALMGEA